jgi:hypothetical protein
MSIPYKITSRPPNLDCPRGEPTFNCPRDGRIVAASCGYRRFGFGEAATSTRPPRPRTSHHTRRTIARSAVLCLGFNWAVPSACATIASCDRGFKPQNADHARQIKERSPRLEHTNTQHRNGNKHSQRIHCGYFAVALPSHLFSLAATYNVCPRMDVWIDSRPRLTLATRAIHFRDRKDHHLNDALPTSRSSIRSQPLGSLDFCSSGRGSPTHDRARGRTTQQACAAVPQLSRHDQARPRIQAQCRTESSKLGR